MTVITQLLREIYEPYIREVLERIRVGDGIVANEKEDELDCYENTAKGIRAKLAEVDHREPPKNQANPGPDAWSVKFNEKGEEVECEENEDYFGYW